MRVLFPAPLGPTIPIAVPGGTCSDTPSSARTTRPRARDSHPPYSFSTPSSRIMGGSVRGPAAQCKAKQQISHGDAEPRRNLPNLSSILRLCVRRPLLSSASRAAAAGKGEGEGGALALAALHDELAAHRPRQVAADGEAQPGALGGARVPG